MNLQQVHFFLPSAMLPLIYPSFFAIHSATSFCCLATIFIASSVSYKSYHPGLSCGGSPAHTIPNSFMRCVSGRQIPP